MPGQAYRAIVIGGRANGLVTDVSRQVGPAHRALRASRYVRRYRATEEFHPGYRANAMRGRRLGAADVTTELGLAQHGYRPSFASAGLVVPVDGAPPLVLPRTGCESYRRGTATSVSRRRCRLAAVLRDGGAALSGSSGGVACGAVYLGS
ncbi:MAG: hypothetical protein U0163_01805 [Gemmatimonadaceae bacterium]